VLAKIQNNHFWYGPRLELLLDLVLPNVTSDSTVLDVGCGMGQFVSELNKNNLRAFGLDPWINQLKPGSDVFICGHACQLPCLNESLDVITVFDVIEHLDDKLALSEFNRVLKADGLLFLSVPAYMALWSERDNLAGHQRRYTITGLKNRLISSGFAIEEIFGYQFFLLPLFALHRLFIRTRNSGVESQIENKPGNMLNYVLKCINSFEVKLNRLIRFPAGTSLIVMARKKSHHTGQT